MLSMIFYLWLLIRPWPPRHDYAPLWGVSLVVVKTLMSLPGLRGVALLLVDTNLRIFPPWAWHPYIFDLIATDVVYREARGYDHASGHLLRDSICTCERMAAFPASPGELFTTIYIPPFRLPFAGQTVFLVHQFSTISSLSPRPRERRMQSSMCSPLTCKTGR